jgi:predicted N-acetyltransferase YhbS
MNIRPETNADFSSIFHVTEQAFKNHPHSSQTEQFIVNELRNNNALSLSLVAESNQKIIGHIAFSEVHISDGATQWYIAGPLSVLPGFQRKGIGSALIKTGLKILQTQLNANGCVLVGSPEYYNRFGFFSSPELNAAEVPQEFVLALSLQQGKLPTGYISWNEAFSATE